jgi:hypothetical protein
MFFQSFDGTRYPSSLITEIDESREIEIGGVKRQLHGVHLSTGVVVDVFEFEVGNIVRQPEAGFAAADGTYIVDYHNGEISKWPVIGWSIAKDGGLYPVTMNGVNAGTDQMFEVLLPTGEVTTYDDRWADLAQWEAEKIEKAARRG